MDIDKFNHEGYCDPTTYRVIVTQLHMRLLPISIAKKWQLIKRLPIFR